jgi:hypothetical protein
MEEQDCTMLGIRPGGSEIIDLSQIEPIAHKLLGLYVNDYGRAPILNLPELPSALYLGHDGSRTSSPLHLELAPNLLVLYLAYGPYVSGVLPSNLQDVELFDFKDIDLGMFSGLKGLRKLEISGARRLETLLGVEHLINLRSLTVFGAPRLSNVANLASCSNLVDLMLENCRKVQNLEDIVAGLPLRRLIMTNVGDLGSLDFLQSLVKLRRFHFSGGRILSGSVAPLFGLKELTGAFVEKRKAYLPAGTPLPGGYRYLTEEEMVELGMEPDL